MPSTSDGPVVAIVVPLFKHSILVVEALQSAISQRSRYPFLVIVVNDGCPFRESDLQMRALLTVTPGLVRYVVQDNRGLSAARNTGIDYALKEFPTVQAIYFMDADNAILPEAIDSAYTRLLGQPEVSWIYPNIDMFGIRRNFDYGGPYSTLMHTQYNICEAGSLVHRRLFDAGIRFDENMKLGYEDWDFWLSAASQGFRGAHHPYFGFRYRNRGESMLSQSHRDDGEIQAYLQRKHVSLLGKKSLLRLEAIECPRYALIFVDTNEVMLTMGDRDDSAIVSQAEFDEMLWRNITIPSRQYIPPFFLLMKRTTFEGLSQSGLIRWVLYDSEAALREMNFSCLIINSAPGDAFEVKAGGRAKDCDVLGLGRDLVMSIIRDVDTAWIERIVSPDPEMKLLIKTVTTPRRAGAAPMPKGAVAVALLVKVLAWRSSPYRHAAERPWIWRQFSIPPPHTLYLNVRAVFGGEVVYPWSSTTSRNIGFVIPVARFGGVERVAYNLAQQFANAGWRAHLFVAGPTRMEIPLEFAQSFASINFLMDGGFGGWDGASDYQGTALPAARNHPGATNRMTAALAWLDAVINCHSGELNAAAADLRRLGVKMATHVHLLDLSPFGRPVGHPLIALAYEHAYDLVLCISRQLTAWMHGAGIPAEKLLHVPNAPGHAVDAARRERILARRGNAINPSLHVLYAGRLDRQKGIERLAEVVKRTRELNLPIEWRIVGSHVTDSYTTPEILKELLEPAIFDSERLTSLYEWAEVMILLSDYEGVPLSVLEAQRLGVVVVATNVGAMGEIVDPGRTGFLIERENAVEEAVALLTLLIENPVLRCRIGAAACDVADWGKAAAEVVQTLSRLVEAGRDRTRSSVLRNN